MNHITTILITLITRFHSMIQSLSGLIITTCIATVNLFAGYKAAIAVTFTAILFDAIWGIAAARKQHKFILSELAKETIKKIGAYGTAIVMIILIENLAFGSHQIHNNHPANTRYLVDIVATCITAVEFWSICGNILIIYPNAIFFRLLKMPLIGEIARKLKISEEEVKKAFTQQNKNN